MLPNVANKQINGNHEFMGEGNHEFVGEFAFIVAPNRNLGVNE
jgi:hypothetical protein